VQLAAQRAAARGAAAALTSHAERAVQKGADLADAAENPPALVAGQSRSTHSGSIHTSNDKKPISDLARKNKSSKPGITRENQSEWGLHKIRKNALHRCPFRSGEGHSLERVPFRPEGLEEYRRAGGSGQQGAGGQPTARQGSRLRQQVEQGRTRGRKGAHPGPSSTHWATSSRRSMGTVQSGGLPLLLPSRPHSLDVRQRAGGPDGFDSPSAKSL
jgi:hypothetical protein